MLDVLATESVPLTAETDGVIRIEGTRVPLDSVIASFEEGATPEEIAQQFPTVMLGVVYQVIGYYLRHREEVDRYLASRAAQRDAVRSANESRSTPHGIRQRLLSRAK